VAFVCLVLLPVIISKQSFLRVIRPVYTELANSFVSAQALRQRHIYQSMAARCTRSELVSPLLALPRCGLIIQISHKVRVRRAGVTSNGCVPTPPFCPPSTPWVWSLPCLCSILAALDSLLALLHPI
jgi:hypothetical protein